jgi:hypothetical protein
MVGLTFPELINNALTPLKIARKPSVWLEKKIFAPFSLGFSLGNKCV